MRVSVTLLVCFTAAAVNSMVEEDGEMPPLPTKCFGNSPPANEQSLQMNAATVVYQGANDTDKKRLIRGVPYTQRLTHVNLREWDMLSCIEVGSSESSDDGAKNETSDFVFRGFLPPRGVFTQYTVTIQVEYLGVWYHICTGALISPRSVITAAHCMIYWGFLPYRCGFGYYNLRTDFNNKNTQTYDVKRVKNHEKYVGYPRYNFDIAMLTVSKCVKFNDYVKPIQPAPRYLYLSYYYQCVFAGWGETEKGSPDKIHARYTRIVSLKTCRKLNNGFYSVSPGVSDHNVCDLDWPRSSDACYGDSGGPVVCRGYVVGLVSWGNYDCNGCTPSVNTGVQFFEKWIEINKS